eukprot:scpid94857/ scgid8285/ 
MSSRKHDVQARRSSRRASPGAYQCGNPFHYQWGSTSTRKDKNARKSLLDVLSSISGRNIKSICSDTVVRIALDALSQGVTRPMQQNSSEFFCTMPMNAWRNMVALKALHGSSSQGI